MNLPTRIRPEDPSELGYPPTLPIEIAMRTAPVKDVCEAYHITSEQWDDIRQDPRFIADLKAALEMLREEGMSFRVKARLQAEELLKTSWKLIHGGDEVPPSVKADLIKATVRWGALEPTKGTETGIANAAFQININLGE